MTRFRGLKLLNTVYTDNDIVVDRPMTRFRGLKPRKAIIDTHHIFSVDRPMTRFRGLKLWFIYWSRFEYNCRQTNDPIQGIKTLNRSCHSRQRLLVDRPMTRFRGLKRTISLVNGNPLIKVDRPMTRFRGLKPFDDFNLVTKVFVRRQTNDPIQGIKTSKQLLNSCLEI